MKRLITTGAAAACALLACNLWAQDNVLIQAPPPDGGPERIAIKMVAEAGAMEQKTVTQAPYSAEQNTVTTQTLADGNRIVHTSAAKTYRDEQGRTRIERSFGHIGPVVTSDSESIVSINDPVAGVRYELQPGSRTAQKFSAAPMKIQFDAKKRAEAAASASPDTGFARTRIVSGANVMTLTTDLAVPGSDAVYRTETSTVGPAKSAMEDLGVQTIEGLQVKGTRNTITIPAGGEGNERPMQIVDERWYSPDLQIAVKTVHSDPRMGETVFTLTNINRSSPDPSLFQVPGDYQVTDNPAGSKMFFHTMLPPPPPPPPAN